MIVFGLIGTTLVALAYQIPRPALAREARALTRLLAPIDQPDVGSVRAAIEDRRKVEVHLGVTTTLLGELHAGTLIRPLLAGAIAVFVTDSRSPALSTAQHGMRWLQAPRGLALKSS